MPKPQKSLIKYAPLEPGTTKLAVHVMHHKNLVLDTMLSALKVEDPPGEDGGDRWRSAQDGMMQWSIDELMKFGVVGLYHLWEKQMKALIKQFLPNVATTNANYGKLLKLLQEDLQTPAPAQYLTIVNECRDLTNAIKHDDGTGYMALEKDYPAYFLNGPEDPQDRFHLSPNALSRLFDGVINFWGELPVEREPLF